jgi:TonB family protein
VEGSHKDVVEFLLDNKADVNARDGGGDTPLHLAMSMGTKDLMAARREIAKMLLANKADINAKNNYGRTPLHTAVERGQQGLAEVLLADKADISSRDNIGFTPLHLAVYAGRKDMADFLLANKADIHAKDRDGDTPLHVAESFGNKPIAEFLLANRADEHARNNKGYTPSDLAARSGHAGLLDPGGIGIGTGGGSGIVDSTRPYAMGNSIKDPVPLARPMPSYTEEARKARLEGVVILQVIIRKEGTVEVIKVLKGLGYGLDESVIKTIESRWRFKPGTRGGEPVDVVAAIETRFSMF